MNRRSHCPRGLRAGPSLIDLQHQIRLSQFRQNRRVGIFHRGNYIRQGLARATVCQIESQRVLRYRRRLIARRSLRSRRNRLICRIKRQVPTRARARWHLGRNGRHLIFACRPSVRPRVVRRSRHQPGPRGVRSSDHFRGRELIPLLLNGYLRKGSRDLVQRHRGMRESLGSPGGGQRQIGSLHEIRSHWQCRSHNGPLRRHLPCRSLLRGCKRPVTVQMIARVFHLDARQCKCKAVWEVCLHRGNIQMRISLLIRYHLLNKLNQYRYNINSLLHSLHHSHLHSQPNVRQNFELPRSIDSLRFLERINLCIILRIRSVNLLILSDDPHILNNNLRILNHSLQHNPCNTSLESAQTQKKRRSSTRASQI